LIQLLKEDKDLKGILNRTLAAAVADLERLPIADRNWGALHQAHIRHMFSPLFNLPSVPRGGDSHTLLATAGPGFDQTSGASYAHVMDVSNWDNSVAINGPGQSGQPGSPHYGDLLTRWAEGSYFRLAFGRQTVEANTEDRLMLLPR